jgi:hypothetical protein
MPVIAVGAAALSTLVGLVGNGILAIAFGAEVLVAMLLAWLMAWLMRRAAFLSALPAARIMVIGSGAVLGLALFAIFAVVMIRFVIENKDWTLLPLAILFTCVAFYYLIICGAALRRKPK